MTQMIDMKRLHMGCGESLRRDRSLLLIGNPLPMVVPTALPVRKDEGMRRRDKQEREENR